VPYQDRQRAAFIHSFIFQVCNPDLLLSDGKLDADTTVVEVKYQGVPQTPADKSTSHQLRSCFPARGEADVVLIQEPWVCRQKISGLRTTEHKLYKADVTGKARTCILAKKNLPLFLLLNFSDEHN